MKAYLEGEVLGIDTDGCLICWNARDKERYNCGQTLEEFGVCNLREAEKKRLNIKEEGSCQR